MTVTPTERVLDLLHARDANVRRQGQGHTAKRPAHDDRKNSLKIDEGDDGRVLLRCYARCDVRRIVAALGLEMHDLFPDSEPPPHGSGGRRGRIVATYDYVDADGRLLYQAVRFEPKRFLQRRPDGHGGWIWNLGEAPRVLYRLPDLLAADHATAVFICEGEKDADRLHNLGLVATTNAMGASAWRPEYADALHGRHVVILPDNDDAGREHAQEIARSLWTVATSIKLMVLPDLPSKGDVSDWLDAGNTAENLKSLVDATPPWTSREGSTDDSGSTPSGDSLPPFPTEIFPPAVRRYVEEGAAALDVPVEMIALPLLGFAAGAIGNSRRIRLKHGYEQGSALWLAVIGRPGSGKTPALDYARHPVDVLQAEASARFRVALREWEHRVNVHKVDKLPGGPPERPREPGYYAVDATWEALAPMLEASPGLALVRDELVAWVRSHDAYRKGGDRQNWLSLWAGTPPSRSIAAPPPRSSCLIRQSALSAASSRTCCRHLLPRAIGLTASSTASSPSTPPPAIRPGQKRRRIPTPLPRWLPSSDGYGPPPPWGAGSGDHRLRPRSRCEDDVRGLVSGQPGNRRGVDGAGSRVLCQVPQPARSPDPRAARAPLPLRARPIRQRADPG